MRFQAHPRRRHRLAPLVVAVASLPVLVELYAGVASRHLVTKRPAIVVVALLVVGLTASLTTQPTVATHPSAYQPTRAQAFEPVTVLRLATPGPAASEPAAPRPAASDNTPDPALPAEIPPIALRVYPPRAQVPGVVRFRPLAGQTEISPLAPVSVRFTVPMDRISTQSAFTASVGGSRIQGGYRWAEGDTVLVLVPTHSMPFGARITLSVTSGARSAAGIPLSGDLTAGFTVAPAPQPITPSKPASPPNPSGWSWPLIGPITQYFGQTLTQYGYHYGIDIDGRTGDPVRAARSGRVIVAGHYDSCGGLEVHIDHGNGLVTWYRHLSQIDVSVGSWVSVGTVIGRVGATGCALGSHLHFAIRIGTTFVDPLRYLPRR